MTRAKLCSFLFVLLGVQALLWSCASGGGAAYDQAALARLKANLKYPHVVIMDTSWAQEVIIPHPHVGKFNEALEKHLTGVGVFQSVARHTGASGGGRVLVVRTRVLDMRVIKAKNRLWGGRFAGQSYMKVRVTLQEYPSKKVVARWKLDSRKQLAVATSPWVANYTFGATDQRMSADMGMVVGDFVLEQAEITHEDREKERAAKLAASPMTADRCRASAECQRYGKCTLENGACVVATSADCTQALVCKQWSYCAALEGACVARSEQGCRDSVRCKHKGLCTFKDNACVATLEEDCKKSVLCQEMKKCGLKQGACVEEVAPAK